MRVKTRRRVRRGLMMGKARMRIGAQAQKVRIDDG